MYDSKSARQDLTLLGIAIENAKCKRDPNHKPENLTSYEGFEPSAVSQALGRFKTKMKGINASLKKENPSFGR